MNESLERIVIQSEAEKETDNFDLDVNNCDFLLDSSRAESVPSDVGTEIYDIDAALRELEIIDNIATQQIDTESESVDTREEDRLRISELEAEVAALKLKLSQAAWIPCSEEDHQLVDDIKTSANKIPNLFNEAAKHGYLPLCDIQRESVFKTHKTVQNSLIYLSDLNKKL